MVEIKRKIVLPNFYGPGEHIYEDDLGFRDSMKKESRSLVPREIFRDQVEEVGLNLAFYYLANDTFYGIHTESIPIKIKVLPRFREVSPFIGFQCESDTHDDGDVIAVFDDIHQIWDKFSIDGKSLEEVLANSYITALN